MGLAYIEGGGGGGISSSDVTALKANILEGTYDIAADSADEVVQGTMPNRGAVSQSLPINGTYTIPAGYHNGSGKVTQNITTKAAETFYATTADQTIASGQYLSGAQTIKKLTQSNLTGANIKPGVTVKVNNGNTDVWSVAGTMASLAAATYYAGTSDQTIAAGKYLSGAQTIKKITQSGLSSENILRGKTISINNGNANVWSVSGSNSVLKMVSGSLTPTLRKSFSISNLSDGGQTINRWMYYADIAPGITPVYVLCVETSIIWRLSNVGFNVAAGSEFVGRMDFNTASDAPYTSSSCRVFGYTGAQLFYWVFGY